MTDPRCGPLLPSDPIARQRRHHHGAKNDPVVRNARSVSDEQLADIPGRQLHRGRNRPAIPIAKESYDTLSRGRFYVIEACGELSSRDVGARGAIRPDVTMVANVPVPGLQSIYDGAVDFRPRMSSNGRERDQ